MVFWDYCLERRARIHILTAKSNFKLHGTNAHTVTTGEEGDKSNLCRFAWYDWCYYREHTAAFPKQREVLGRVLGHARGDGNEMSQWILKAIKSDGTKVWDFVLIFTDDTLVISEKAESKLRDEMGKYFEIEQESIDHQRYTLVDISERFNWKMRSMFGHSAHRNMCEQQ
jgi:hypothetical protein